MCIQISVENDGKRIVTNGAFHRFCEKMGLEIPDGNNPKKSMTLIKYILSTVRYRNLLTALESVINKKCPTQINHSLIS
jgi:hypothetical protein